MKVRLEADFDDFEEIVFYRRGERTRHEEVTHLFGLRRRTVEFTNYAKVLVYVKFKDAEHFEAQGKDVERLPFTAGVDDHQAVPGRAPRRPGDAVPQRAGPDAADRQAADRRSRRSCPGSSWSSPSSSRRWSRCCCCWGSGSALRREPVELNQGQLVALGAAWSAFGGYLVRQFTKFKNRKIQFMKALSENLYFRNLDNDAGVFHHLLDAAEEEEVKEAVLAYHFLRTAGGR